MAATPKPAPPSFYKNMAGMKPSQSMKPPAEDSNPERNEIVGTLFKVFEKWSDADKEAKPTIDKMMQAMEEFVTTVMKKDPSALKGGGAKPGGDGPSPAPPPPGGDAAPPPA